MNELPAFPWFRLLMTGIVFIVFVAGVTARSSLDTSRLRERRSLLDLHALSDGGALVLWEEPSGEWIARIDSEREHWRRRIPGAARHIASGGSGIGVAGSLVVVQYTHPQRQSYDLLGIELTSGALRWSVFIESPPFSELAYEHKRSPVARNMYAHGDHVIMESEEGWKRIDPRTGGTIAVVPGIPEVANGALHARFTSQTVSGAYDRGIWCTVASKGFQVLFKWIDDVRVDALLRSADSDDIVVPDAGNVRSCAEYEGKIVLYSEEFTTTRVRIVSRSGTVVRDLEIPGRINHYEWNRDRNVFANRLPRFLLVEAWKKGSYVHVVDLEQGSIVRSIPDADLSSIVRTEERWVHSWWAWRDARAIEVVDSRTGVALGRIAVSLGVETKAHHVGGGYLWVFEKYGDALTYARIELATMRVDVNHGRMWVGYSKAK